MGVALTEKCACLWFYSTRPFLDILLYHISGNCLITLQSRANHYICRACQELTLNQFWFITKCHQSNKDHDQATPGSPQTVTAMGPTFPRLIALIQTTQCDRYCRFVFQIFHMFHSFVLIIVNCFRVNFLPMVWLFHPLPSGHSSLSPPDPSTMLCA